MTPASVSLCLSIIAASLLPVTASGAGEGPTPIGRNLEALLGAPYDAFAGRLKTESRSGASCISVVAYGLRSLGLDCAYADFRDYFAAMSQGTSRLELGVTPFPEQGAILFDRIHFTVTYSDSNRNGVIDGEDAIIHAPFGPVVITPINEWLGESEHPVYITAVEEGMNCPISSSRAPNQQDR